MINKMDKEKSDLYTVSATDLNRGKASSYLKVVHEQNKNLIVIKHSEPYAVILSIQKYNELLNNKIKDESNE